ncbi:hypothetical protein [Paenibacillus sp. NEAU-GSW1]|uniref:hypothetical protein n=1 Tax=Paenibacillus sp. NEAU-GSW1 TaxID=2682486 RepID=UPI0012E2042A|nr:hypothetical protein [Paenibacillus sp. NEAU-GSW1]MUT67817.1 hypothetical protein [Paenibacillus sp. NEAU-GSW1]
MDQNIISIIAVVGTLSGIALGWLGKVRSVQQDTVADVSKDAALQADMAYLKRGIDDLRVEIKVQGQHYNELSEKVIRLDESLKSVYKRVDKLEVRQ